MLKVKVQFYNEEGKLFNVILPTNSLEDELYELMKDDDYHLGYKVVGIDVMENEHELDIHDVVRKLETLEEYNDELSSFVDMIESVDLDDVRAVMNAGLEFTVALDKVYNEEVFIRKNIWSKEDYAREYVDEVGGFAGVEFPRDSNILYYLDWEAIADTLFSGDIYYDEETRRVINFNY